MSFLSRDRGPTGPGASPLPLDPGEWGQLYPALVEFLSASQWPEGDARVPGTLTIFVEGALWKACLSDRDQHRVVFASAVSPAVLLRGIEEGLVAMTLDWRAQRPNGPRNPKKSP